jgi:hypothetical protein
MSRRSIQVVAELSEAIDERIEILGMYSLLLHYILEPRPIRPARRAVRRTRRRRRCDRRTT